MSSDGIESNARTAAGAQPAAALAATQVGAARALKKPGIALLLAFIFPGLGQIYNGEVAKALVVFFGFFGSLYAAVQSDPLPFVFFMPLAFLYGVVDAATSAGRINQAAAGRPSEEDLAESPAWGATLVGIGVVLLLNNLGWLRLADFQRFWPVLLIVAGALFIRGSLRRREAQEASGETRSQD